jgi:hypothetical protein
MCQKTIFYTIFNRNIITSRETAKLNLEKVRFQYIEIKEI